jgi:hypothetical protein
MKKFKDNKGDEWEIRLSVAAIRNALDIAGVDLRDPFGSGSVGAVERLLGDPLLASRTLYAVAIDQAKGRDVTPEKFDALQDGDTLHTATALLLEELPSMFPSANRSEIRDAIAKICEMRQAVFGRVTAELSKIDVKAVIDKAMADATAAT